MADVSMSGIPEGFFPDGARPVPGSAHERYVAARLAEVGDWGEDSLARTIRRHAAERPEVDAFVTGDEQMTWADYDRRSDRVAAILADTGLEPGERVAVIYPDGPTVHALFVGIEKAGLAIVGIGPRAGASEIEHLVRVTGATGLVSAPVHRGKQMSNVVSRLQDLGLPVRIHVTVDPADPGEVTVNGSPGSGDPADAADLGSRSLGVGDIWLINSTSGTTGLPKCVVHNQNRWIYYHTLTTEAGEFTPDDVFMSVIPAPFGFGVWTGHVTPTLLGAPTVVMPRFSAEGAIELIERYGVTVLSCVSTQFIMMLNSEAMDRHDLSSLRSMFTGGEAVPYERSAEFEDRTGARVLQFYGSNETGGLSRTRMTDTREQRLRTAGRVIDRMEVRLFDDDGADITATGGPGQAACAGPATCLGYYGDPEANDELITDEGWMLTGDICTIDADGYLEVVGRKSDFIIRGGKNISAPAVEEEVSTHPAVAIAAAVAMPDEVFGERVCVYVELQESRSLELDDLLEHLRERGVSKSMWPERLEVVDRIPRSSGGKIAKGELRDDIRQRLRAEHV